jgi:hypothetical protein
VHSLFDVVLCTSEATNWSRWRIMSENNLLSLLLCICSRITPTAALNVEKDWRNATAPAGSLNITFCFSLSRLGRRWRPFRTLDLPKWCLLSIAMSRRAAGLFISVPSRVSAGVKLIVLRDSLTADIIFNLHVTRYQPAVPTSRGEKGSQRDGYLFTPRRVYASANNVSRV